MKNMYNVMAILLVFTNVNCAMDAIVACASKGSLAYSLIMEVEGSKSTDVKARCLSVPTLHGTSDTSLDTVETSDVAVASTFDDDLSAIEKIRLSSAPIPIVCAAQEDDDDEESEAFLSYSLPKSFSYSSPGSLTRCSFLHATVGSSVQTDPGTLAASSEHEPSSEERLFELEEDAHVDPLSQPGGLRRTQSFSDIHRRESIIEFDEDACFASEDVHPVEAPRGIPVGQVTVTFTRSNRKETVVWGGGFEHYKTVCSLLRVNPSRCQTPLTPVNQVIRRSITVPGSRTSEVRLHEAAINCLMPIQFETHPLTREEVVKIKPRPTSPLITGIET